MSQWTDYPCHTPPRPSSLLAPPSPPTTLHTHMQLVVATGKARGPWAFEVLPRLQLDTPGVFMQGLLVYDADGVRLYEQTLPYDVALDCIALAGELGALACRYRGPGRPLAGPGRDAEGYMAWRRMGDWEESARFAQPYCGAAGHANPVRSCTVHVR